MSLGTYVIHSETSSGTSLPIIDEIDAAEVPVPGGIDDPTIIQVSDAALVPDLLELRQVTQPPKSRIIGFSCRLPRAEDDVSELWELLVGDCDCTSETPTSRYNTELWTELPGRGGFLADPTAFEPEAFGMRKREAASSDPQQFLVLECLAGALDKAGLPPEHCAASGTKSDMLVGVYIGRMNNDAEQMFHETEAGPGTAAGVAGSISAAEASYRFGLVGPSMVVDTACSSALVTLNLGNAALLTKQTDIAGVGGVNWLGNVKVWAALVKAGMVSDRCRPFSLEATGYGRAEGCGIAILAPADFSPKNGAATHAEIVGSAVNSDGRGAVPITKPYGPAQEHCARMAWGDLAAQCRFLEAHGTGTKAGDPVEAGSIAKVFGEASAGDNRTRVGAVKSNMNHLESAAGMAGLAKLLLVLEQGIAPPFGNVHGWRPDISTFDFFQQGLLVNQACDKCWDDHEVQRFGGANSFGFGGTNATVALVRQTQQRASWQEGAWLGS